MKLAIIGGSGLLGSTAAFVAAQKNIFEEIKLLGRRKNLLRSHAMDMEQALLPVSDTRVTVADYDEIEDCQIIYIAASAPALEAKGRDEYLKDNLPVIDEIAEQIAAHNRDGVILTATNPVDVFNEYLRRKLKRDRRKMLGFSSNDCLRLKWAVAKELNLSYRRMEGYCIGEHGDTQVPLMGLMTYDGRPLAIPEESRIPIKKRMLDWFSEYQKLGSGRTSGWTSAVMACEIFEAIATDSGRVIECSVPLDGEFSYHDVSVGMPVRLGKEGAAEILLPKLTDCEAADLDMSVCKVKQMLQTIL